MRIGIPKALIYYYYYPVWKTFFESLGCEVVVSGETTPEIVEKGVKSTVSEICVPIKIFDGHVVKLLEMGVDYVFVPRFVSVDGREWFCPKFLGLPDLVRHSIPEMEEKMLTVWVDCRREDMCDVKIFLPLAEKLSVTKRQIKQAVKKARAAFLQFRELSYRGYALDEALRIMDGESLPEPETSADLTIGVMGYVYNVYDKVESMEIVSRLRKMGVRVVTFDMLNEVRTKNKKGSKVKKLFWIFTRKIYNVAEDMLNDPDIDGVIHVTAFACGPDSVLGKMLEMDSEKLSKPFMTIRVDEHTGESHLQTRIEAFVDMLRRKNTKAVGQKV